MIMERINPPMIKAMMLRDGQLIEISSLSELGIYSLAIIDSSKKDLYLEGEAKKKSNEN